MPPPETLHSVTEENVLTFLIQVLVLLGLARTFGYACRRVGQPSLVGEILVGVILGPTLLGRIAPQAHTFLFPGEPTQQAMLDTVSWIGLLFLLLSAGLEVDVSVAWRQRGDALKISLSDIILPMVIGFVPAMLLPDRYLVDPGQRVLFAMFIAAVMTISALPMSVKALHDLDLLKTDLGLLAMSALTINDIVGWAIFTLILGIATQARLDLAHVGLIVGGTLGFGILCVTVGRRLVAGAVVRIQRARHADGGLLLTFVCCVGLLSGAASQQVGIHAMFGFFLAGIMCGGTPALSERTRQVINQMVYAVFVPVFFAGMALRVDFVANFDPLLAAIFTVVGIGGRYLGAWVGARLTSLSPWDRVSMAIVHTPGGAMEMVMALVALRYGLITVPVFVGIVFAALASSVALGPWLAWSVRRRRAVSLIEVFVRRALRLDLCGSRWQAIQDLCEAVAAQGNTPPAGVLAGAVTAREQTMGTAIGNGVALPHARLSGLTTPVIALGRCPAGIEWNSPDGLPVQLILLILTPENEDSLQLQIMAALARAIGQEEIRRRLLEAGGESELWALLREAFGRQNLVRIRD